MNTYKFKHKITGSIFITVNSQNVSKALEFLYYMGIDAVNLELIA